MNTDSPAGMMMKFASETTKPFVDDYLLSHEAREAVRNGYLHIHDKDYYPRYLQSRYVWPDATHHVRQKIRKSIYDPADAART